MKSVRIACSSCGSFLAVPASEDSARRKCKSCRKSMFMERFPNYVAVFLDHNYDDNQPCILFPCKENAIKSHITPKAWLTAIADQHNNVRRLVPWRTRLLAGNMHDIQTGELIGSISASHLTSENRTHHRLESVGDAVSIGEECTAHIFCEAHDGAFQRIDDRPTSTDFENWDDAEAELMIIRSWAMDMMRDSHYQLPRPDILGGYERNVFFAGEDIIYDGTRLKLCTDYRYAGRILKRPAILAGTAFYYGPDDWISMSFIPINTRNGIWENSQGMFVCSNNPKLVDEITGLDEDRLTSRSLATFDDLYISPIRWESMAQETREQIDFRVSFRVELDDKVNIFNT